MDRDKFNHNVDFSSVFSVDDYSYFYKLAMARMPFGRYAGTYLKNLPENYLIWLRRKNILSGELAAMIEMIYEIKLNGLEYLLEISDSYTR